MRVTKNDLHRFTGWKEYRKKVFTKAVKMEGPFVVTTSEGDLHCEDGYLAIDARGYPYPIATEEFNLIYEAISDAPGMFPTFIEEKENPS